MKRAFGIALGILVVVIGLRFMASTDTEPPRGVTTPLHEAAAEGHLATAEQLIDEGAAINARDEAAKTPLHFAAEHGHMQTVSGLMERGADPTAVDVYGRTAYEYAHRNGHTATAKRLAGNIAD